MEETRRYVGAEAKRIALIRLGQRLRNARLNVRKTQSIVAEILGTSTQTVRNWEAGRNEPSSWAIGELEHLYSVPRWELLYGNHTSFLRPAQESVYPSVYPKVEVDPERMADARRLSNLTQEAVARVAGVSVTSISRYERGVANPTIDTLEILGNIYGISVELLMLTGDYTDEERAYLAESMDGPGRIHDTGYVPQIERRNGAQCLLQSRGRPVARSRGYDR